MGERLRITVGLLAFVGAYALAVASAAQSQTQMPASGPASLPDPLVEPIPWTAVRWIDRPDPLEVGRIMELHGQSSGSATIDCILNRSRRPRDCTLVAEQLRGDGRRAMELAKLFQATRDCDTAPLIIGKRVRFTFSFHDGW